MKIVVLFTVKKGGKKMNWWEFSESALRRLLRRLLRDKEFGPTTERIITEMIGEGYSPEEIEKTISELKQEE